jgi:hypothetical protein
MITWNDRSRKRFLASKQMFKIPHTHAIISLDTQIYVTAVHPLTPDTKSDRKTQDFRIQ